MVHGIYHFRVERPRDDLKLGDKYAVDGKLAKYLKNFQLDGVRFLYKNFERNRACILNDESGLGKTAVVVAFLNAIILADTSKRCLIVAKNQARIEKWQFHLDVLTKLRMKVLQAEEDIGNDHIYFVSWETLRKTPGLARTVFNCVILDDRGELTASRVCLNFFLRHFENRISLIVASTDVTLDIKQLHGLLRLSGHLEEKYRKLKVFEEKFALPAVSDYPIADRALLEAYFQRREKIINYCRDFRLRRYRHQFEDILPLVTTEAYERSLTEWRKNQLSKSPSSTSSSLRILSSSSSSSKNTEELFQTFFDLNPDKLLDDEVRRINENAVKSVGETEEMSPLIFESDSEDVITTTVRCNQPEQNEARRELTPKDMIHVINETEALPKVESRRYNMRSRGTPSTSKCAINPKTPSQTIESTERPKSQLRKLTGTQQRKRDKLGDDSIAVRKYGLRSFDRKTRSKSYPADRKLALEISQMIEKNEAEAKKLRKKKRNSAPAKQETTKFDENCESDEEFPAAERLEYYPDPDPEPPRIAQLEPSISIGSEFNIDLVTKSVPVESTEINIYSPDDAIVVISSSNESCNNSPAVARRKVRAQESRQESLRVSPSPDIFENYEEFDLMCSQQRSGRRMSFAEFKILAREASNRANSRQSCLDSLEHAFRTEQKQRDSQFSTIVHFRSDHLQTGRNKIPKYMSSQSVELSQSGKAINNTIYGDPDSFLRTPKRQTSSASRSSLSLSKKSPKSQRTTPVTPNGLTKWLIKKTPEADADWQPSNTTKRKRLDLWFKD